MGTIVVGIDGSEHAKRALEWAVAEARLRGSTVEAVYAYEYTPSWQRYGYADDMISAEASERVRQTISDDAAQARERAVALAERMVAEVDTAGVTVEPVAVENRRPASALVEHSKESDMLVIGSRGRGGFTGLLLGSVSQQCAHHADCPVVILRHQD